MDLRIFQNLYEGAEFDEIRVIGKDIEKEGRAYHILGLLRKDRKVMLSVLELGEPLAQTEPYSEKTHREQMKNNSERNHSFFMRIRSFQCGETQYEVSSVNSGSCEQGDFGEAYLLFMRMLQAGWRVPEESPFYKAPWEKLVITNIELRDEMEQLPEWNGDVWVSFDTMPEEGILELPIILETGKTNEVSFALQNGRSATCYINRVHMLDVWADEQSKFENPKYRERMLQHMTETEFSQMKEQVFEALPDICPKGMCFPVIEYECTENVGLQFYEKEYLDTSEKPKKGRATSIIMLAKPETETGSHGLKMRACVLQSPMEKTTETIETELFSYREVIQKGMEKLCIVC